MPNCIVVESPGLHGACCMTPQVCITKTGLASAAFANETTSEHPDSISPVKNVVRQRSISLLGIWKGYRLGEGGYCVHLTGAAMVFIVSICGNEMEPMLHSRR